jgi:predicted transcriptional regulator
MTLAPSHIEILTLTTEIASSYVSNNKLEQDEIPQLIDSIYKSLSSVNSVAPHLAERPQPAVPIKRSLTDDYIICLEDGKKLKMLKRHLKTSYNMTPEEYRERWGLPADYPMVAPSYAKRRSSLAKDIGLGKKT